MDTNTPRLRTNFFDAVERIPSVDGKVNWYMCVVVNLAAINYPELLPNVWAHIDRHLFPGLGHDEQFKVAQKLREALIKACGIMGAAKTGTAMRTLCKCIPDNLRDPVARRSQETQEQASARGHAFWRRIYARNPEFDPDATGNASPDYAFVVRDLLYGRIFSFDAILSDLETGSVIVSTLIGLDCQNQLRNHLKGMLYNGATREELEQLQDLCLGMAKDLGVTFRSTPRPIPSIDD
ncbi:hypothetical protein SPI_00834 [Niveomyces insectorum RCEF 264]|uniref:Carboxymuconolactone decarboxylase n=1 Tax=Niveomyces insectorum RCEF 264 TaxID=1081102 RepID=A0A162MQT4_9HYPO|nr:hypothetical protein SPI_00834 [Niveomyces insectorum RCEF 264]